MQRVADMPKPRSMPFDPLNVRNDFPILQTKVYGKPLVYLDNGATTQKPRAVIDAISRYYESQNANIHRGVYHLSQLATTLYEESREKVRKFINAADARECIFTRGTTEGINLVGACWGRNFLKGGDEVVVSAMEHHSNIVPWQMACDAVGAKLRVIPMNECGELQLDALRDMLASGKVRMISVVHLSNSLGTINDVKMIAKLAHERGALVMVDGAQWVAHYPTDVQDLGVDFYAFSGHKLLGPTGIGVLWGKRELLEKMPPYQGGGDMIESVTFEKTTYAQLPNKFEAGTPDIAGVVGLGAAVDYVSALNWSFVDHEHELLAYATEQLGQVPGLRIVGTARNKGSVISLVVEKPAISAMDLGTRLDREGIAVRTGHHCCMPVMAQMNVAATTRASFAMYNTNGDVDALVSAMQKIVKEASTRVIRTVPPDRLASASASPPSITELKFPKPFAASPSAAADRLANTLDMLGDRDARNTYLLELADKLLPMPAELKNEQTRVHGCMSTVHLFGRPSGDEKRIDFLADSDAHIVRGLIAVLQRLYSGQRAQEILDFDVEEFFRRIGLDQFITSQRRNGLAGMVSRIRATASRALEQQQGAA
jgi:cysteine desulfurase / selenocysteine lyase